MNAASVSRILAAAGDRPLPSGTPYSREGVRVKRGYDSVVVVVDLDSDIEALRRAVSVSELLVDAGFSVESPSPRVLRVRVAVAAAP